MKTPLTDQWEQSCKFAWKMALVVVAVTAAEVTLVYFIPSLEGRSLNTVTFLVSLALIIRFVCPSKAR